jgi:hypothetical protein
MSKLVVDISMSLDGLIAGPNAAPENPWGTVVCVSMTGTSKILTIIMDSREL